MYNPSSSAAQVGGGVPATPPGWKAEWSTQYARYFYVDLSTGQSVWTLDAVSAPAVAPAVAPAAVPAAVPAARDAQFGVRRKPVPGVVSGAAIALGQGQGGYGTACAVQQGTVGGPYSTLQQGQRECAPGLVVQGAQFSPPSTPGEMQRDAGGFQQQQQLQQQQQQQPHMYAQTPNNFQPGYASLPTPPVEQQRANYTTPNANPNAYFAPPSPAQYPPNTQAPQYTYPPAPQQNPYNHAPPTPQQSPYNSAPPPLQQHHPYNAASPPPQQYPYNAASPAPQQQPYNCAPPPQQQQPYNSAPPTQQQPYNSAPPPQQHTYNPAPPPPQQQNRSSITSSLTSHPSLSKWSSKLTQLQNKPNTPSASRYAPQAQTQPKTGNPSGGGDWKKWTKRAAIGVAAVGALALGVDAIGDAGAAFGGDFGGGDFSGGGGDFSGGDFSGGDVSGSEALDASMAQAAIEEQGRQNALMLLDPPGTTYTVVDGGLI